MDMIIESFKTNSKLNWIKDIETPSHFIFRSVVDFSDRERDIVFKGYEKPLVSNAAGLFHHHRKIYFLSRIRYLGGYDDN